MAFIELTNHGNKKKIAVNIHQIAAIFEVENSTYSYVTRIILSCNDFFDVDESYEKVIIMIGDFKK